MAKMTDWYPGDVKPLAKRVGLYERDYLDDVLLCYWDGVCWFSPVDAGWVISMCQSLPWRGLAKKPGAV